MIASLILLLLLVRPTPVHADIIQILVNDDHSGIAVDRSLLRAIFSMRLRAWPDGAPIRVFVLPDDDPISAEFCRDKLGTYPYVLRAVWDRMTFTGTGLAPTIVKNEQEMRLRVRGTPGAIGYIHGDGTSSIPDWPDFAVAGLLLPPLDAPTKSRPPGGGA